MTRCPYTCFQDASITVASQAGAAAASASSAARTASPASSSRLRSRIRASTCVESVRCRIPGPARPASFSLPSSRSSSDFAIPPATSRSRNSLSTLKSNPGSASSRPRQYFQSIRLRTASAACRSVRFSVNCKTVTTASCAGDSPGLPRVPYAALKSPSWHQAPSSSRTRIASDPPGNAARATCAVRSGTAGHCPGLTDMMTPSCSRERQRGKEPATAQSMTTITGRTRQAARRVAEISQQGLIAAENRDKSNAAHATTVPVVAVRFR